MAHHSQCGLFRLSLFPLLLVAACLISAVHAWGYSVDLAITSTDRPDPAILNHQITFTLSVKNESSFIADNVVVRHTLPTSMTYVNAFASQGTCTFTDGVVTANLGNMDNLATADVRVVVTGNTVGRFASTATVQATETDTQPSDNTATAYTSIIRADTPIREGFDDYILPPNDDQSTERVPLGFSINYYGLTFNQCYVNNNGNITFDEAMYTYSPFDLNTTGRQIIAPFFGDVDTRGLISDATKYSYGIGTVGGRPAFGVDWVNVGYFGSHTDKLNSFQLIIIDRSDISEGAFDFEFNYDKIQWETGDASGGQNGFGGHSARAGFSNGTRQVGTFYELPGSAINGALLDSNADTGLIYHSLNSNIPGRYVFKVRNGMVEQADLSITKESADEGLTRDVPLTYTIRVQNSGPTDASDVVVTDPLPSLLTYVSATSSQGTVDFANGTVTANLGGIAVGGEATITLVATPRENQPVINTATVNSNAIDPNQTNNIASCMVDVNSVTRRPDIWLRNTADTAYLGDNFYSLTGVNQVKTQSVYSGVTAQYFFRVQNDGNTAESFTILGPAGAEKWSVKYRDTATNSDITAAVTGTGWETPVIEPDAYIGFVVQVTPANDEVAGAGNDLTIIARSTINTRRLDAARLLTDCIVRGRPDLHIRKAFEAAFTGENIYNVTGQDQSREYILDNGVTAIYQIRIQNDGNTADNFVLTAPLAPAGWTVKYYDASTGGTNITTQISGAGWSTRTLHPDEVLSLRAEVTSSGSLRGGAFCLSPITARSANVPDGKDVVHALTTVSTRKQPDQSVQVSGESGYVGENRYNTTGENQERAVLVWRGVTTTFRVRVQNDGNTAEAFTITGPTGGDGWTIRYVNPATGGDITGQITGAGWNTGIMNPAGETAYLVQVTPTATVATGTIRTLVLRAVSSSDDMVIDAVKATVTVRKHQPDLQIRCHGEATYQGNDIYNLTGALQTKTQTLGNGMTTTYLFHVQNDGNTVDNFVVTCPPAPASWKVRFFDIHTNVEITNQVVGMGWITGALSPGAGKSLWATVTPDNTVTGDTAYALLLTATSSAQASGKDTVKASTSVALRIQPDLLLRTLQDVSYFGDGLYSTDGNNQTRALTMDLNVAATYMFRIQNDGNTPDSYTITAPAGSGGWRICYVDGVTNTNMTLSVTGAGWTVGPIAPGAAMGFWAQVTPTTNTVPGAVSTLAVSVVSAKDQAKGDVAKVTTTYSPVRLPDLHIRAVDEATYRGAGVYNADGADQTTSQSTTADHIIGILVKVENDGQIDDRISVTGPASMPGWTMRYYNAETGGMDVTAQATRGGWATPTLSPGNSTILRVELTPSANASARVPITALISATSLANLFNVDAVKITALRSPGLAMSPWPMFHRSMRHTGDSPYIGPSTNAVKWSYTAGSRLRGAPVIDADGNTYIGAMDGQIFAFTPAGSLRWAYATGSAFHASPVLCNDDSLLIGAEDGTLYALYLDGSVKWTYHIGAAILSSPTIGPDGAVYVGANDSILYAMNADGTPKWSCALGAATGTASAFSSPVVAADGTIYIGSRNNKLYAIAPNGTVKWTGTTGGPITSSPAIASDGTVYIGSADKRLYAYDASGIRKWSFVTGDAITSSPAVGADGTVYVGSNDQKLYAVLATGQRKWAYATSNWITSSPAVDANGTVYVGADDGLVYAVNAVGQLVWSALTGDWVRSSPAIGTDGTVYIGSDDGKFYAFGPGGGSPRYAADLLIRLVDESTFIGDGIISAIGENQVKTGATPAGGICRYIVRVQNDSNVAERFTLLAPDGKSGWTLRFSNMATGDDITGLIQGEGWQTPLLAAGASLDIQVDAQAGDGAVFGQPVNILFQAVLSRDGAVQDGVRMITGLAQTYQPDLWIRRSGDTVYLGDNILNTDGAGQTRTQSTSAGASTALYLFRIQNDGNGAAQLTLTAPAAPSSWSVKYYDTANTDITAQINGDGWTTSLLAPQGMQNLYALVTPRETAQNGTSYVLSLTACAADKPLVRDVVLAVTTKRE